MNKQEPILDIVLGLLLITVPVAIVTFLIGSLVLMLWRLFA